MGNLLLHNIQRCKLRLFLFQLILFYVFLTFDFILQNFGDPRYKLALKNKIQDLENSKKEPKNLEKLKEILKQVEAKEAAKKQK